MAALLFLFFIFLVVPVLLVGVGAMKMLFGVRSLFKKGSDSDAFSAFRSGGSQEDNGSAYASAESDWSLGNTQKGRHRLDMLKNRAEDTLFEEVEIKS